MFQRSRLCILLSLLLGTVFFTACSVSNSPSLTQPHSRDLVTKEARYVMGSVLSITIVGKDREDALQALDASFREARRLDELLSSYKPDSEISRLNTHSGSQQVSDTTYSILQESLRLSQLTEGAFNIAAQSGIRVTSPPIRLLPGRTVELRSSKTKLDLGGIGKGYAVDRILKILKEHQVSNALINFGKSSWYALGRPSRDIRWKVAIHFPETPTEGIELENQALSASQNETIIDPLTGNNIKTKRYAWIISDSATTADALSTALIVKPELADTLRKSYQLQLSTRSFQDRAQAPALPSERGTGFQEYLEVPS